MDVLIIGSCVSRDTFSVLAKNQGYKLLDYVARQSLVSAQHPGNDSLIDETLFTSPFQFRSVRADVRGDLWDRVHLHAPAADLILMDLIDERRGVALLEDGTVLTDNWELVVAGQRAALPVVGTHALNSEEHFTAWLMGLDRLVNLLRELESLHKLLVIMPQFATQLSDGSAYQADGADAHLERNYERYSAAIRERGLATIQLDQVNLKADSSHRWGLKPFHYAEETEQLLAQAAHRHTLRVALASMGGIGAEIPSPEISRRGTDGPITVLISCGPKEQELMRALHPLVTGRSVWAHVHEIPSETSLAPLGLRIATLIDEIIGAPTIDNRNRCQVFGRWDSAFLTVVTGTALNADRIMTDSPHGATGHDFNELLRELVLCVKSPLPLTVTVRPDAPARRGFAALLADSRFSPMTSAMSLLTCSTPQSLLPRTGVTVAQDLNQWIGDHSSRPGPSTAKAVAPPPGDITRSVHYSIDASKHRITEHADVASFVASSQYPNGYHVIQKLGESPHNMPLVMYVQDNGSPVTVVFFHGAIDHTFALPVLNGMGISRDLPINRIFLSDPSLVLDPNLKLAWFAGSTGIPLQGIIEDVIRATAARLDTQRLVFFGSSGGGFASLYYSSRFADSICIANNPQTNIARYQPVDVAKFAEVCFSTSWPSAEVPSLPDYVSSDLTQIYQDAVGNHVLYLQNSNDAEHLSLHLKPFLEALDETNAVMLLSGDWGPGHAPAPKEVFRSLLRAVVAPNWHEAVRDMGFQPAAEGSRHLLG